MLKNQTNLLRPWSCLMPKTRPFVPVGFFVGHLHYNCSMESFTAIFSIFAAVASAASISFSLWQLFRTPDTFTVTRKDTGKSVVINTRADWREGAKLAALLDD